MKTEFVTLSPTGAFALVFSGFLFGQTEPALWLVGILALLVARENAREQFVPGSYQRGWFVWRKVGPIQESATENNIVPFRGPAA